MKQGESGQLLYFSYFKTFSPGSERAQHVQVFSLKLNTLLLVFKVSLQSSQYFPGKCADTNMKKAE